MSIQAQYKSGFTCNRCFIVKQGLSLPDWMHITWDILTVILPGGDMMVYDNGYLTFLEELYRRGDREVS